MGYERQKRKVTMHGMEVEQMNLGSPQQPSWYTTVEERVRIAHQAAPANVVGPTELTQQGFRVTDHAVLELGDRLAYTCTIEYPIGSGRTYPGSDFIVPTDKDTGLAKAETSAIGRALGFAGIAIDNGIASANEITNMRAREGTREGGTYQSSQPSQPNPTAQTGLGTVDATTGEVLERAMPPKTAAPTATAPRPYQPTQPQSTPPQRDARGHQLATEGQKRALTSLAERYRAPTPDFAGMTYDDAAKLIRDFSRWAAGATPTPTPTDQETVPWGQT